MKKSFVAAVILSFALAGCASTAKKEVPKGYVSPQTQDFMATGRGLSKGAVDLYQPGSDFLPTEQFPNSGPRANISSVPRSASVVSNDPSVTIYSLDTMEVQEPSEPILPPGVPAIQPPLNLQSDYPSPFDKNGNPIP
jgi:hypothetical protein